MFFPSSMAVALTYYEYEMLKEMAEADHRTIARQLGMYIQEIYNDRNKN